MQVREFENQVEKTKLIEEPTDYVEHDSEFEKELLSFQNRLES